ncbi:hypothetical protein PENTCL1PPCAC_7762, partial [Pristionchus entomophagus]
RFADGRTEFIEFPINIWREKVTDKKNTRVKVDLAKDGTLRIPKVTSADSAQYSTYYIGEFGLVTYKYFNVKISN